MLDQNTDRMWYVIGAVLIGAAIIFGMNTFMPSAFASVTNTFDEVLGEVNLEQKPRKNYLLDSSAPKKGRMVDYYLDVHEFNELQGNTVTISFDAKAEVDDHHAIDVYFRVHDGTIRTFNMSDSYIIDNGYERLTYQMEIPNFDRFLDYDMSLRFRGNRFVPGAIPNENGSMNAGKFTIRRVKMELGNSDTGYIEHESEQDSDESL